MSDSVQNASFLVSGPLDRLFHSGRIDLTEPAILTLEAESNSGGVSPSSRFEVIQVLRYLPGRRLVCVASTDDGVVVVKWFLGSGSARYQQRELRGHQLLRETEVPTPSILQAFDFRSLGDSSGHALVFEYLQDAQVLTDEHLLVARSLFAQLFGLLAAMHQSGVVHNDLHFGNLMCRPSPENGAESHSLWLIDTDAVERSGQSALGRSESVEQFVRLATQTRSPLPNSELRLHWQNYCLGREYSSDIYAFDLIARKYRVARRKRISHFQAKMRRSCSAVAHRRTILGEALLDRSWLAELGDEETVGREMLGWLDALPGLMDERDERSGDLIKNGNTATVVAARFQDQALIVKRYNNKSVWHRLRRWLRPDRGLNSWVFSHTLGFTGIATAPAVALLRTRFSGPTYLVMQRAMGVELDPVQLAQSAKSAEGHDAFEQMSQKLLRLISALGAEGLVHHDTKASNFLWDKTDNALTLIDLDAMTLPASQRAAINGHERDRLRLLRNFAETPDLQRRLGSMFGNHFP